MKTIGITGGIGSGKSVVCKIFNLLGVPVYNADEEAKKLYDAPEVMEAVKKTFGDKYFTDDKLNKKQFGSFIFSNKDALNKINAIIHPIVQRQFKKWKKSYRDKPYVIKEAAILFESGSYRDCDKIIIVTAPQELRIARIIQRDNRKREDILEIISNQWSDEEKFKRSDFAIINDEKELIIPQVLSIHKKLVILQSEIAIQNKKES